VFFGVAKEVNTSLVRNKTTVAASNTPAAGEKIRIVLGKEIRQ
jgi:hypothetical protein